MLYGQLDLGSLQQSSFDLLYYFSSDSNIEGWMTSMDIINEAGHSLDSTSEDLVILLVLLQVDYDSPC